MGLKTADSIYLILIVLVILALPLGITAYDRYVWHSRVPDGAVVFHLTGHTQKGWVLGNIRASDVLTGSFRPDGNRPPVLKVKKGDHVVLKLTSSDVIHGFSLKDFGIFINDGIHPGKPVTVSFTADREGHFTFACNAICGSQHEHMSGAIIVSV